jgi:hypothetical protein
MVSFRMHVELEATRNQCDALSLVFRDQTGDILPSVDNGTFFSTTDGSHCWLIADLSISLPRAVRYTVVIAGQRFGPVNYDSIRASGAVWRIGGFGA